MTRAELLALPKPAKVPFRELKQILSAINGEWELPDNVLINVTEKRDGNTVSITLTVAMS